MSRAWITERDDGRIGYKFHQSWLADTDLCLERARLGLVGELNDGPSDASSAGTSMHHGIETVLEAMRDGHAVPSLTDTCDRAQEKFTEEIALDGFEWKKRKERGARNYIDLAVTNWYQAIMPKLDPWVVEQSFGPYVLYEDDKRVVSLGGTIDYVDRKHGIMDWKTGSKHGWDGKDWEKARWAVQPTIYTWAWRRWLLENGFEEPEIPMSFRFVVMRDDGAVQKLQVHRRPEDWAWIEQKVRGVIQLIEADLPSWPLNDTHALCSEKWCPAFATCKGAHVAASWPK